MKIPSAARRLRPKVCIALFLFAALWATHVLATDNYVYQDGEYAIVSSGRSPDGKWSVAAHGNGECGYDDFHLYLMREPAHAKSATLHIDEPLDTGPLSIATFWAPDSSNVLVLHRTDRHVLELRLFSLINGKAQQIKVPLLVDIVARQRLKSGIHQELIGRLFQVVWQKPRRFILKEFETFDAAEPIYRSGIEPYLLVDRMGPDRTYTSFSASAVCEITRKGRVSFSGLKPLLDCRENIVYSPNLRFDREHGLYVTETTMSPLAKQKAQN